MAPSWRTSPLPRNWPTIQPRILRRDDYLCQIRGPHCTKRATEVDHKGDPDDHRDEMLQAVCHTCHASKTGRDAARIGNARRPKRQRTPERHPGLIG